MVFWSFNIFFKKNTKKYYSYQGKKNISKNVKIYKYTHEALLSIMNVLNCINLYSIVNLFVFNMNIST